MTYILYKRCLVHFELAYSLETHIYAQTPVSPGRFQWDWLEFSIGDFLRDVGFLKTRSLCIMVLRLCHLAFTVFLRDAFCIKN